MKTINNKCLTMPLGILCAVAILLGSCTKEPFQDCSKEAVLHIVAVDVEGEEIDDPQVIEGVVLYIFDNKQKFLRTVSTSVGNLEPLFFPNQDTLHIVSWGNLTEEKQQIPDLKVGSPMHEALVHLKLAENKGSKAMTSATNSNSATNSKSATNSNSATNSKSKTRAVAQSPDDLFYSYDVISLKSGEYSESYKLFMSRASAAMSITMRNLQSYANRYDDNYSLVVRETYSAIDFYGQLTGNKVGYIPTTSFNDKKEMVAPLFNLLPSDAEGTIEIDVYHNGEMITTVQNGPDGKPLRALRGEVLNILVDFHLTVTVEVGMTPWGETIIWKDF